MILDQLPFTFLARRTAYCDGHVEPRHIDQTEQQRRTYNRALVAANIDLTSTDKTGTKFVQDTQLVDDTRISFNGTSQAQWPHTGHHHTPGGQAHRVVYGAAHDDRSHGEVGTPPVESWRRQLHHPVRMGFRRPPAEATPSSTISHKFPESDRDYTVLVVVSEKGLKVGPLHLERTLPGCTEGRDRQEKYPAASTPRPIAMYSTLEVKGVNLGVG